jgi:hypothetical protein
MAKDGKVRLYKKKLTKEDHKEMERSLLKISKAYKWLRQDAELSKNKIRKALNIRIDMIYQTFRYAPDELSFHQIATISKMLPDKTFFEVVISIYPEYNKLWFEIADYEEEELLNKIEKYGKE